MYFKDIPGHESLKSQLIQSVQQERLAHAQLFLGESGSCQLALSLALASYILCHNRTDEDSCGTCVACIKSHKLAHPDLHFSFPVIGVKDKARKDVTSNDFLPQWRAMLDQHAFFAIHDWMTYLESDNKQPDINVKECVEIIQKLTLRPFESEYKVLIMWRPEYLGKEGNRLLKLIEEPTDNTFIILVAEDQQLILNTILSRCQVTFCGHNSRDEITNYLTNSRGVDPTRADKIATLADGNLGLAIQMSESGRIDYAEKLLDWLRLAYQGEPIKIQEWADEVNKWSKEEVKFFFQYGLSFLREYLHFLAVAKVSDRVSPNELQTMQRMQKMVTSEVAESLIDIFCEAIDCVSRNINTKIWLTADTLRIGFMLKNRENLVSLYKF